ncbi:hypothetical protein A5704_18530 [Mycobacterium sp. E735]|nr:hypothetical protein A5704_18530 [Mycobacterium sp. E735]
MRSTNHDRRIRRLAPGEQPAAGPSHRSGQFVDRDVRARWDQPSQLTRELLDAMVEFEVDGPVQMVVGHRRFRGRSAAKRHEQVRMFVVGEHDRDRALHVRQPRVQERPTGARRVSDVAVHQQYQRVHAVIGHRGPQPSASLGTHARPIRLIGDVDECARDTE